MNSDVCNSQLHMIKLWNYILVWLIHITSMHISFGKLYAYIQNVSYHHYKLYCSMRTRPVEKKKYVHGCNSDRKIHGHLHSTCTSCFVLFLLYFPLNISLWALRFSCGLLKFLVQGPTWPLENFTKLHPCIIWRWESALVAMVRDRGLETFWFLCEYCVVVQMVPVQCSPHKKTSVYIVQCYS